MRESQAMPIISSFVPPRDDHCRRNFPEESKAWMRAVFPSVMYTLLFESMAMPSGNWNWPCCWPVLPHCVKN